MSGLSYESLRLPPAYKVSVVKGKGKLIFDKISKEHELYDLKTDPSEKNNLAKAQPELVSELDTLIQNFIEIVALPVDKSLTLAKATKRLQEEIQKLKSLGYF